MNQTIIFVSSTCLHYLIIGCIWITGKWQWLIFLAKLKPHINMIIGPYGNKIVTGCSSKDLRIQLMQVGITY